jgi:peptidoglycan/xylan/chitin deacetylase (PgdA/CDA1 family)
MRRVKEIIRKNISNIPGWRTKRKILVIESDDWGSVRIKDKQAYQALKQKGLDVDRKRYDQVDTLESNEDLELLFSVLQSVKDKNGQAAKITPMCLVGNPDFDKIKTSNYQKYHFQPLNETISEFPQSDRILNLWQEGVDHNVFVPELHGREHVNVRRYIDILQSHEAKEGLRFALDYHSLGPSTYKGKAYPNYLGALHPMAKEEIPELKEHLLQAGELFEQYTGYKPRVFMAPNAEEPKELEAALKQIGVQYLTRAKRRIYPMGDGAFGKEWNFVGQVNKSNQLILNRNAFFEPCQKDEGKTLDSCLQEINLAFKWKKPAVVSSHRVNYVGGISEDNREEGLHALRKLLKTALHKWPDIEFMTSFELGETIKKDKIKKY